jgi:hypothetical protein
MKKYSFLFCVLHRGESLDTRGYTKKDDGKLVCLRIERWMRAVCTACALFIRGYHFYVYGVRIRLLSV